MWRSASAVVALMIGVCACGSESATTSPATAISEPTPSAPDTASTTSSTGSVVAPTTLAPLPTEPAVDVAAALAGWNWERSAINRACGDVWWEQQQVNQRQCTAVVVDPQGIPVSYDPLTRRVTRERREGAEPVAFTLPEEYVDASLMAAGPA
jgi:hypothetical protein